MDLTHLDEKGRVRMVDVTEKPVTERRAVAYGEVKSASETIRKISADEMGKGDVLTTAKIAGISAAKRTGDLIPMCHPIPLTHVEIDLTLNEDTGRVGILAAAVATRKDRCGNGGLDRSLRDRPDHLRHVQGRGPDYGNRFHPAGGKGRRQVRHVQKAGVGVSGVVGHEMLTLLSIFMLLPDTLCQTADTDD